MTYKVGTAGFLQKLGEKVGWVSSTLARDPALKRLAVVKDLLPNWFMTNLRDSVLEREARKATRIDPAEALRAE